MDVVLSRSWDGPPDLAEPDGELRSSHDEEIGGAGGESGTTVGGEGASRLPSRSPEFPEEDDGDLLLGEENIKLDQCGGGDA